MNAIKHKLTILLAAMAIFSLLATTATAHPLPNQTLKFSQLPMDQTQVVGQVYWGHDEFSTAYRPITPVPAPPYRGVFMADDFADTLTTPVVHVRWWGSYLNQSDQYGKIQKFLISFENDVPTPNGLGFSYPDPMGPIHSQIVIPGALSTGSGTFTETPISPGGPPLGETLYEYNAELAIPFPQQADTVHWLKIVALVDHNPTITAPEAPGAPVPQWGWHNRDYTQQNGSSYVSTAVTPGENQQGNAAFFPIWHFQDDAVSGRLDVNTFINSAGVEQISPNGVVQHLPTFNDEFYIDNIDGPQAGILPGFQGISSFSKDLAFELYTVVPEPATCTLMVAGLFGAAFCHRRRKE
jgi:hypothetical protein